LSKQIAGLLFVTQKCYCYVISQFLLSLTKEIEELSRCASRVPEEGLLLIWAAACWKHNRSSWREFVCFQWLKTECCSSPLHSYGSSSSVPLASSPRAPPSKRMINHRRSRSLSPDVHFGFIGLHRLHCRSPFPPTVVNLSAT